jgi:hypothetical protein
MMRLVQAEGRLLQRIVATTPLVADHGLSREAFAKYDAAQAQTSWALRHRRRDPLKVRRTFEVCSLTTSLLT